MNYTFAKTNMVKIAAVFAILALAGMASFSPTKAHAGNLFDPLCLWSGCDDDGPSTVTTNNTNSNNTNSNVNSPGGVVSVGSTGTVVVPIPTPIHTYNYPTNNYSSLNATCYATPTTVGIGETTMWRVSAYGGTGNYHYTWSGTDGLSGNGSSISMSYGNRGTKHASVTIISGGQSISRNCDNSVYVNDDYYYNNGNNYNYNNNYYNSSPTVSCIANTSFAPVGQTVRWTASVSGGNGYYTYRWNGTDGISGTGQTLGVNYSSPGTKYATVNVYSNGQSVTRECQGGVTVGVRNNQNYGNTGNLEIACFADAERVRVGVPVTWAVEATGGDGSNYSYAWTGTEGLTGSQRSAVTAYSTTGTKSATVTVTSGGVSGSKICGNVVTVVGATTVRQPVAPAAPTNTDNGSDNSAAALFSLANVPWGWVAVLAILVLLSMVMYLLFTRREQTALSSEVRK
jgi:hypothetical protein